MLLIFFSFRGELGKLTPSHEIQEISKTKVASSSSTFGFEFQKQLSDFTETKLLIATEHKNNIK